MQELKINYKYKVAIYFAALLIGVGLISLFILIKRQEQLKLEKLTYHMHPYTQLIYNTIKQQSSNSHTEEAISRLGDILPGDMRVTILDSAANVIYDNRWPEGSMDNHTNRPEISAAATAGYGWSTRNSSTLNKKYLYYARKFPDIYVRTALEYDTSILPYIRTDISYKLYILVIFLLSVAVLLYLTRKISRPYSALKEFIDKVENGDADYDKVTFPKDELGEVGEKIMNAFRQLELSKKYRQELTHNIAHELKTPVTGIRGYLETLLEQEGIDEHKRRFFLERTLAQTLRLNAIVNDIAILNKIEDPADKFDYQKINICSCIREIENDLSFKLEERNIRFAVNIELQLEIEGNYLLIYSLFKNLIDNSIEHAGEGTDIFIQQTAISGNMVHFTYYDTGKGVPEEHLERIFERFYRVEKGRSRKSGGSGLGLSIVKNAILLHGGSISVKNRYNGGLQFDFSLSIKLGRVTDVNVLRHQSDA